MIRKIGGTTTAKPVTTNLQPNAGGEDGPPQSLLEIAPESNDPELQLLARELFHRIKECMSLLRSRQRIVAEMVWFKKVTRRRVAGVINTTEPNVSELLKLAQQKVLDCARSPMRL